MLAVLRQRNFLLVWTAGLISLTGDWLLIVALPLVIYELTGSTAATAAAVVSRIVPRLLLGSVAGVFVDRWDRRRTMLVTNVLLGLSLLPLFLVRSADWLWLIYLMSFIRSAVVPFFSSAENAFLPRLVGEEDLVPANALNGLNDNLARLAGPPLGGLVAAVWGLTGAALLDAASFFLAAMLMALVAVDGRAVRGETTDEADRPVAPAGVGAWVAMWREWVAGLIVVRQVRTLAVLFTCVAIIGIGEGVMGSLFVPFVTTVIGGGGVAYGWIVAAQAVGGLAGSAVIGRIGKSVPTGLLYGLGVLLGGTIDLMTFNAHRIYPGVLPPLVLMAIVGLPFAAIGVGQVTLIQTAAPDEYRGRVFASLGAVMSLSVLVGAGLAGVFGDRLGIVATLTIDGVAYILAGMLALALLAAAPLAAPVAVPEV
jgi:MFS family permease